MSDQRDGGIAWTDQTWNPTRGCSRVSRGCEHCYAEGVARRFSGPGMPYEGLVRLDRDGKAKAQWNGVVRLVPEHLADPLRWTRPRRVFVNSMSDLFHESLSFKQIASVFAVMSDARRHTFQVLTKRPKRARDFFRWVEMEMEIESPKAGGLLTEDDVCQEALREIAPHVYLNDGAGAESWPLPNVWLGVSVEDQATADERIPHLLACPAAVRWVSYEPAIERVDFGLLGTLPADMTGGAYVMVHQRLHWIVVGGESGPGARPFDLAWARSTIAQCREADVACFVKQLGAQPVDSNRSAIHDAHGIAAQSLDHDEAERLAPGYAGGRVVRPAPVRIRDRKGGDMRAWPEDLRVREYPTTKDTTR